MCSPNCDLPLDRGERIDQSPPTVFKQCRSVTGTILLSREYFIRQVLLRSDVGMAWRLVRSPHVRAHGDMLPMDQ